MSIKYSVILASIVSLMFVTHTKASIKRSLYPVENDSILFLKKQVNNLPQSTTTEKWKKAALLVDIERMESCNAVGEIYESKSLYKDIVSAIKVDANKMLETNPSKQFISVLNPVLVSKNNPYINQMVAGASEEIKKEDIPWSKSTPLNNIFKENGGPYGSRTTASKMQALLWLVVNPASPMLNNEELFKRLFRRYLAYVDAINVNGKTTSPGQLIFDDFAIAPASCALRELDALFPNLLLPSQKQQLNRAMRIGADIMYFGKAKDRLGTYANIDLALSFELLNFGLYLNDTALLSKSKFLMEVQEGSIYPDGGIAYIFHQNESHAYHETDVAFLTRYYEILHDSKSIELIKKTEWYGPVTSAHLAEFWTVPSWKGTWNSNSARPAGGESVASLTSNPYLRWMLDNEIEINKSNLRNWEDSRLNIPWYRNDIQPKPIPNNYTILDRNTNGPRAWYGKFNYATTLRPIPSTEPGLATLMGAQLVTDKKTLDAAVLSVYPRVRIKKDILNKDSSNNHAAWAWLTDNLKSASILGKNFSAIAGKYQLHQFGSSTKGPDVDWNGHQLWIGLPDRIIGLLSIAPTKDQAKAYEVDGVVSLSFGGTATGSPKKAIQLANNTFQYGDFIVKIHEHNFNSLVATEVPFRLRKAPITEILMKDSLGEKNTANLPLSYPASTNYSYLVEIKSAKSAPDAQVKQVISKDETRILQVELQDKKYIVWFNPTASPVDIKPATFQAKGIKSSFRTSEAPNTNPIIPPPATFKLLPFQAVMLVSSKDETDHQAGWENYQSMVNQLNPNK